MSAPAYLRRRLRYRAQSLLPLLVVLAAAAALDR